MHTDVSDSANAKARDPFRDAREKLFPPLRNKALAKAADALAENRTDVAQSLVSQFLEKKPADPAALNLMADIARRAQRFDEAERLLWQCTDLAPASVGYRFNLVVILRRNEKFEAALAQLEILLRQDCGNALFQEQKAHILSLMERHDESLPILKALAETHPTSPRLWFHFGKALAAVGSGVECIAAYHKALALEPSLTAAYAGLSDLKTYRFTGSEVADMEQLLTRAGVSADERAELHSALGKAFDNEGLYAKAFDNYAKGNALRRLRADFDPGGLTAHRLNCESLFTPDFIASRKGWGCGSHEPIFIVGMPRSGSTLIEQILSSHSAVEGLGERPEFDNVAARFMSSKENGRPVHDFWIGGRLEFRSGLIEAFPRVVAAMTSAEACQLGQDYLDLVRARRTTGKPFFSDKGLRNFGYVGLIHLVLPNAKIIDVRRHPLDCGWSCFHSHFPGGQPFANRLADIGRHYANYVRLMKHFHAVLPGCMHTLIYERLVTEPEGELRRLFAYLEIPFEPQCLRFHENRRIVQTISSQQVRMPLYKSGVGRWRPYEAWLGPLKSELAETLQEYASPYTV